MCGRGACSLDPTALKKKCNVQTFLNSEKYAPSYNICPHDFIPVLLLQDEMLKYYQTSTTNEDKTQTSKHNKHKLIISAMRWGLMRSIYKDGKSPYLLINARRDNVKHNGIYKRLIKRKRCVVLFNGYYEWKNTKNSKNKQAYYFTPKHESNDSNKNITNDPPLMYMAALWDIWRPQNGNDPNDCLYSVSIITTDASKDVSFCHHRMPLIMKEDCIEMWLNEECAIDKCFEMIDVTQKCISIQSHAVPREIVGNTKQKGIKCIQTMDEYAAQKRKTGLHKYFKTANPAHVQKKKKNDNKGLKRGIVQNKDEMKVDDDDLMRAIEASKISYKEEQKIGGKRTFNEMDDNVNELHICKDKKDEQPTKKQKLCKQSTIK